MNVGKYLNSIPRNCTDLIGTDFDLGVAMLHIIANEGVIAKLEADIIKEMAELANKDTAFVIDLLERESSQAIQTLSDLFGMCIFGLAQHRVNTLGKFTDEEKKEIGKWVKEQGVLEAE